MLNERLRSTYCEKLGCSRDTSEEELISLCKGKFFNFEEFKDLHQCINLFTKSKGLYCTNMPFEDAHLLRNEIISLMYKARSKEDLETIVLSIDKILKDNECFTYSDLVLIKNILGSLGASKNNISEFDDYLIENHRRYLGLSSLDINELDPVNVCEKAIDALRKLNPDNFSRCTIDSDEIAIIMRQVINILSMNIVTYDDIQHTIEKLKVINNSNIRSELSFKVINNVLVGLNEYNMYLGGNSIFESAYAISVVSEDALSKLQDANFDFHKKYDMNIIKRYIVTNPEEYDKPKDVYSISKDPYIYISLIKVKEFNTKGTTSVSYRKRT